MPTNEESLPAAADSHQPCKDGPSGLGKLLTVLVTLCVGMWVVAPDVSNPPKPDSHASLRFGCPSGYLCDYDFQNLALAASAAANAGLPLRISGQWYNVERMALPSSVYFEDGSVVQPSYGATITLSSPIQQGASADATPQAENQLQEESR